MKFTLSLVEYLVIGSCSFIWIFFIVSYKIEFAKVPIEAGFLLLPILYATGMLIDSISSYLVSIIKKTILTRLNYEVFFIERKKYEFPSVDILATLISPELGNGIQIRSSRDRIARGFFLNCLILFIVVVIVDLPLFIKLDKVIVLITVFLLMILSALIWTRLERLTNKYREEVYETVKKFGYLEKHQETPPRLSD